MCVAARESLRKERKTDTFQVQGPSRIQKTAAGGAGSTKPAGQSSGVAVGVVGGPQLGHPLAQVVHELKHGGGEAGLDEVARQAALRNKHRKEGRGLF